MLVGGERYASAVVDLYYSAFPQLYRKVSILSELEYVSDRKDSPKNLGIGY